MVTLSLRASIDTVLSPTVGSPLSIARERGTESLFRSFASVGKFVTLFCNLQ